MLWICYTSSLLLQFVILHLSSGAIFELFSWSLVLLANVYEINNLLVICVGVMKNACVASSV